MLTVNRVLNSAIIYFAFSTTLHKNVGIVNYFILLFAPI